MYLMTNSPIVLLDGVLEYRHRANYYVLNDCIYVQKCTQILIH